MQESQQDVARPAVLLPLEAVCARVGCGLTRVYKLLNDGVLEAVKDGKSTRVVEASLDKYIASLPRWTPTGRPVAARDPTPLTVIERAKTASDGQVAALRPVEANRVEKSV